MTEITTSDRDVGPTLLPILSAYDLKARSGSVVREEVFATLERVTGFRNRVQVGSGHVVMADEPVTFGGTSGAPDPAEALLAAALSSLSVTITAHAAMRDVPLAGIRMDVSAWMAADSFFRPDGGAEPGMQGMNIVVILQSDVPQAVLDSLVSDSVRASPVLCSLARQPTIELRLESGR